ncbi:MAG TPA: aminoglycoside phosphotransferase family protein [Bradyrhizobium sp.]|uniref:aminoglycoside phosphotransferase family protein n=1 Tax=Bradyrhizobium sp. TaxID=376 RepID=UPI002CF4A8E1|nr:aminoglycoside phosphotransferase family protein [Bradyrhizobium sp.]HLZ01412.1 aminoglycoside phosphotransferase family protein [Bradyrhizobium sp.]
MRTSDALADDGLLALATALTARAGFGRARSLTRLVGGRNNQVFRIDATAGAPLVMKRYFSDPRDMRDRLAAEWDFLERAWNDGVRTVPQPLAKDDSAQAALYSFVVGRRLEAGKLEPAHIDAAADFILAINATRRVGLGPASDACFSISDHLQLVERRLLRLAALDREAPQLADAERFVFAILRPRWDMVREQVTREAHALGLDPHRALAESECCLSPSDFGFHNALAGNDGRLVFLDFEYAGRDDPAKLVVDFFCQPQVPVPSGYRAQFLTRLALDDVTQARCRILLDVCRVKWVCILLNDFLPVGAARRAFAATSDRKARCAVQLEKAKAMLSEIRL